MNVRNVWPRTAPSRLRLTLQRGASPDLRRRRGVIMASLVGMGAMTAVTLLQTGIVKHLPDPPLPGFDSDHVNSSDTAYRLGLPDGPLALASLAANIPLAALGDDDRVRQQPWIPVAAAAKATAEALAASWYFYQMPVQERAWCGYCIVGALANLSIAALTLPEARRALRTLSSV
jgi:uncharacterized membrane protein